MPLPLTFFSFVFMEHRNFLESGELSVIYVGHGIGITSPPGRIPKSISSAGTHVLKNGIVYWGLSLSLNPVFLLFEILFSPFYLYLFGFRLHWFFIEFKVCRILIVSSSQIGFNVILISLKFQLSKIFEFVEPSLFLNNFSHPYLLVEFPLISGSLPDAPCTIQHRKTVHLDLGRWTSFGHFHSDPIPVSSIVTLSLPRKNPNSLLGTQEANNLAVLLCLTQQPQSNTTNNINTNLLILQSVYVLLPTISMLIRQTNYRNFSACMKLRENLCTCSCINHMAGAPITIHHTLLLHPTTKINTLSGLVSNLYRSTQSTL